MDEGERLQKVLAGHGLASRRGAETMIAAGRVTVNGQAARLGQRVVPGRDHILVDGVLLAVTQQARYLALNKPVGIVSTLRSTHGEPNVTELVSLDERVFPVGRLDKDTSGLLLLTNDGEWSNAVTHPRYGVEKEYLLVVRGVPSADQIERLRSGVTLPDGVMTAPARVDVIPSKGINAHLSVTVVEGKKRQLRLMAASIGHPVVSLQRVRIGAIRLGDLPDGRWRRLSPDEVNSIRVPSEPSPAPTRPGTETTDRDRRSRRFR